MIIKDGTVTMCDEEQPREIRQWRNYAVHTEIGLMVIRQYREDRIFGETRDAARRAAMCALWDYSDQMRNRIWLGKVV